MATKPSQAEKNDDPSRVALFAVLFTFSVAILLALATRVFFGIFFKG